MSKTPNKPPRPIREQNTRRQRREMKQQAQELLGGYDEPVAPKQSKPDRQDDVTPDPPKYRTPKHPGICAYGRCGCSVGATTTYRTKLACARCVELLTGKT